ncbi:MAG: hypothetical protein ABH827_02855 [bacterium]
MAPGLTNRLRQDYDESRGYAGQTLNPSPSTSLLLRQGYGALAEGAQFRTAILTIHITRPTGKTMSMHTPTQNSPINAVPTFNLCYSHVYDPIYETSYDTSFIFNDQNDDDDQEENAALDDWDI